jgi:hypothetical protein
MKIIDRKICLILTGTISFLIGIGIGLFYDRHIPLPIIPPDLHKSQFISIEDGWTGLAIYSPVERSFALHRSDNVFIGNGTIRVGGDFVHSSTSYISIQIPSDEINKAIDILTRTNLEYGRYEPVITHPGDYPYIKIVLIIDGTRVEFYTSSQSPQKNPWEYKINNQSYVTHPGDPYRAYVILKKYLRDDIQEELEDLKKQYKQN